MADNPPFDGHLRSVSFPAMLGPEILVRSMTMQRIPDQFDNLWQYHPQSDRHSKIACWAALFDLLRHCPLLRKHAESGKVGFGINHTMIDFTADRKKDLDLVVAVPRQSHSAAGTTFAGLAEQHGVILSDREREILRTLPVLHQRPVGDVLLALESKAAMTAQVRAGPRLYDELTSAWQCINGSAPQAVAVAFGIVNAAAEFISPKMNKFRVSEEVAVVGRESQPRGVAHVLGRFRSLRVRGHVTERGFDAVGVTTVVARNDGSPIVLASSPPALPEGDSHHYETMILRSAGLYDGRFVSR